MSKYTAYIALSLAAIVVYVNGLPAADSNISDDVEIVKSKEIPVRREVQTLEESGKKLNAVKDLTKEASGDQKTADDDDRGKRMLGIVQTVLQNILQPQPIVDTISEEDKYGNTGDTLGALGKGIVGGSEALSNFVNLAIEYPTNLFKSLAHRATEALNRLGSRLVGL